ncbi:branched-chain amino acid aminotransferase [Peribacillus faecalis]|uniref:branched-chain amino acid aminotransferase n=1 Tax=Peribacillus faecalis TaxID=2772559 RepID=UPI0019D6C498|nr:branched-chain amino acid aminotransferase [Peribacillus faecalis]
MSNQNCENVNNTKIDFQEAYVERCDKETENVLAVEEASFLNNKISYFKEHKNEYMYIELDAFEAVKIDGLTLEMDDVFGTYSVMAGLKLQKKWEAAIKNFLDENLSGEGPKYSMLFNQQDGLWDLNFTLNYLTSFEENESISKAVQIIIDFLATLNNHIK